MLFQILFYLSPQAQVINNTPCVHKHSKLNTPWISQQNPHPSPGVKQMQTVITQRRSGDLVTAAACSPNVTHCHNFPPTIHEGADGHHRNFAEASKMAGRWRWIKRGRPDDNGAHSSLRLPDLCQRHNTCGTFLKWQTQWRRGISGALDGQYQCWRHQQHLCSPVAPCIIPLYTLSRGSLCQTDANHIG